MKKKVKKVLKKHLTGISLAFGILFLVIGLVVGFLVYSFTNKEGFTKIELSGDSIVVLNVGDIYQEEGFTFVIDDKDYSEMVVVERKLDTNVAGTYVITYTLNEDGHNIILSRVINVMGGVYSGE